MYRSKTWVLKSEQSRSHKACKLFVLLVQPVFLCSNFRRIAKLSMLQRKGMCKNGWRKNCLSSGKWSLNFSTMVQYFNPLATVHKWTQEQIPYTNTWSHWGQAVFQFVGCFWEETYLVVEILLVAFPPCIYCKMQKQKQKVLEEISLHCYH